MHRCRRLLAPSKTRWRTPAGPAPAQQAPHLPIPMLRRARAPSPHGGLERSLRSHQRIAGIRPSPPLTCLAAARLPEWTSHAHAPAAGPRNRVRPPLLQLRLLPAPPKALTPLTLAPHPPAAIPARVQRARVQSRRAMCPARCRCSGAASWASARRAWPDARSPQSPPRSAARSALATAPAGS